MSPEIKIETSVNTKDPSYIGSRREILLAGTTSDGLKFWIVDYGSHPCGYIEVPQALVDRYDKDDMLFENSIDVHGGITWYEKVNNDNPLFSGFTGMLIGWDYAHAGDYFADGLIGQEGKRYTTSDILLDVIAVSEQLAGFIQHEEKHST